MRRPFALVALDLAAHLVIGSASRCDECHALGAGSEFERKAALPAAHASQHERHPVSVRFLHLQPLRGHRRVTAKRDAQAAFNAVNRPRGMLSNSPIEVGFARKLSGRSPDLHLNRTLSAFPEALLPVAGSSLLRFSVLTVTG